MPDADSLFISNDSYAIDRVGVIYMIECEGNGYVYVGSTMRRPRQRWMEHLHYLRKRKHFSPFLQRVFDKWGEASLSFRVIEDVPDANLMLAREQFHIWRNLHRLMNGSEVSDSTYAAHAARRGKPQPIEEREKRSKTLKAYWKDRDRREEWTGERRRRHSEFLRGRSMPPVKASTRKAISEAKKGKPAHVNSIEASKRARTAFIAEEVDGWIAMRNAGMSYRDIESKTGRSRKTVARECKARGCK